MYTKQQEELYKELMDRLNAQDAADEAHEKFMDENTPEHYNFDIQPWDYMESLFSEEAFVGFLEGNIIKYVSRWRDKNGSEDLRKAGTYLDKLIDFVEGE